MYRNEREYLFSLIEQARPSPRLSPDTRAYLLTRCLLLEDRVCQLEHLLQIRERVAAIKQAEVDRIPAHPGVNRPRRGKGALVPPQDVALMRELRRKGLHAHEIAALTGWSKKAVWENWQLEEEADALWRKRTDVTARARKEND